MTALDIGLRASVVVLLALAASVALRRRSAALRHWVLAAGILSAAAVAPLGIALPAWDLPLTSATIEVQEGSLRDASAPEPPSLPAPADQLSAPPVASTFPLELVINAVWAAGVAINLLVMLIGLRRLSQLTASAHSLTDARWLTAAERLAAGLDVRADVLLQQTGLPTTLGTWGWRRPCVLLPAGCEAWSDDRIRVVLGHELAHIRRGDWALQMATDVVRAIFWYNPLFWFASARLRRESEAACDNAVLEAGVPAADYADHL